jgi:nucleoside phosphorylase
MGSAAVRKVCFINEVDWLVIRSIKDLAEAVNKTAENNVRLINR